MLLRKIAKIQEFFLTIDSVLNPKLEVSADTSVELCERFLQFFVSRISEVRNNIHQCTYVPLNAPETPAMLSELEPISISTFNDIIFKLKATSAPQDIIPTTLLRQIIDSVGPIGIVPEYCKHAVVQPLLKKEIWIRAFFAIIDQSLNFHFWLRF